MIPAAAGVRILRFAAFELDLRCDELRRSGVLIKLPPQPFRILRYLAEHSGDVVTRDEIQREIWGSEVFVDFDRNLNVSIAQIRAALHDDSDSPRFIQTVPRRGYRFLAPVEAVTDVNDAAVAVPQTAPAPRRFSRLTLSAAALLLAVGLLWYRGFPAASGPVVLAVLPFENVTRGPQDAAAIEGLADELITQFGAVLPGRLGVIGRTSVTRLASQRAGVAQIGRELSAAYILEGDWRSEGARVRITTRLVKVAGQLQIWNDTYETENAGTLQLEEEVAARVTAGVAAALFPQSAPAAADAHTPSRAASDALVNGRYLQHARALADMERAIAFFEQAGQLDPAWAEPWSAIAETHVTLALARNSPGDLDQAGDAATRALKLNEASPAAHNALAVVLLWRDWNAKEAARHFGRALSLNPSFAQAHHDYAFLLIETGRAEAGVAELRRAIAIDPLSPRINVDAGWLFLQAHRFDDSIAQAKRALALDPSLREAEACIARAAFARGAADPRILRFYQTRLGSQDAYERAIALSIAGRKSEAIASLREALQKREMLMTMVATEPAFTPLAADPAFRDIVAQVWHRDSHP